MSICRVRQNDSNNTEYTAREMMFGVRHTFEYFECGTCQCLQIAVVPDNIGDYYPNNYYSFGPLKLSDYEGFKGLSKRIRYRSSVFQKTLFQRLVHALFGNNDFLHLHGVMFHRATKLLDVGCGNGKSFLYPLRQAGFSHVAGCDPFLPDTLRYSNGLVIEKKSIFDMQGTWQVITYHHAFEHVPDPLEQLQKVASLLSDGGVCILRIPTASSWAWKHYGIDWCQLDAPRHLFLHSKKSIELLAARSGLELYDVVYDSTHFQVTGSEKLKLDIPLTTPNKELPYSFVERKWNKWKATRKADQLNKKNIGDQAAFFLRKKGRSHKDQDYS